MLNNLLSTVFTGDFMGFNATGVEEDNPIVILLLALHTFIFG
jgi:hypothetical protein